MNIQHLRYFLKVMETGSVSRAADSLGVTQPTLSVALKRLEREFGARLFVPDGRRIKPLAEARLLEAKIRVAVRALSEAKRDIAGPAPAALTIGILPSLAETWLASLLQAWDGPVDIIEAPADDLGRQVADGAIDLALTVRVGRGSLPHKLLLREPFLLFVGPSHPFAGRRTVALSELAGQPFVLRQSCELLGTGRRVLEAAHIRIRVVARTRQEATAAALVLAGPGCTLAPRSWLRSGLHAVAVNGLSLERSVVLTWKTAANAKLAATMIRKLASPAAADMHRRGN